MSGAAGLRQAARAGALVLGLLLVAGGAQGQRRERPPIGDLPTIGTHLDQGAIDQGRVSLETLIEHGEHLFRARFNTLDGQGRPGSTGDGRPRAGGEPNFTRASGATANSCAGCHIIPRIGGAGDFVANTFLEMERLDPVTGFIHPSFGNERNTLGMHGSGPIEMLAREMTAELIAIREGARERALARAAGGEAAGDVREARELVAKGIAFGRIVVRGDGKVDPSGIEGVDWDLIVKPFRAKGSLVSIREISGYSLNHHHGMQATETFGVGEDPDRDGVTDEITAGDLTALTIYQASLGTPGRVMPADPAARRAAETGAGRFAEIGCATCHVPSLPLSGRNFIEPNPYNPPQHLRPGDVARPVSFDMTAVGERPRLERAEGGGAVVRAYTDLKRHDLNDAAYNHFANEQVPEGTLFGFADPAGFYNVPEHTARPKRAFLTRKLWDAGSSDPYGHRGDLAMLTEAIHFHGGAARQSRDAFFALPPAERAAIIEFLRSLQLIPLEGGP